MGFFSKKEPEPWVEPGELTEITREGIEEFLHEVELAYLNQDPRLLGLLLAPNAWITEKRRFGEAFVERREHRNQLISTLHTILGVSQKFHSYQIELSEILSLSATSAKVRFIVHYHTSVSGHLEEKGVKIETLDLELFHGRIVCSGGEIVGA